MSVKLGPNKMNNELADATEKNLTKVNVETKRYLTLGKRRSQLHLPFRHGGRSQRLNPREFAQRSRTGRNAENPKRTDDLLFLRHFENDDSNDDTEVLACSQSTIEVYNLPRGRPEVRKGRNTPGSTDDQTRSQLQVRLHSPFSLLGPGEGDPFLVLPSDLPRGFVDERLYSARSIIADMVSRGPSGGVYGKAFAMNIMSSITSSPALFYAMMVGESMYSRAQKRLPQGSSMELEVGARAVQHISHEMRNPSQAVSDANIWAVLTLGYSGRLAPLRLGHKYPRQSFLKELQSIHIYCRMEIVYAHVFGLMKLIELLGGVHKIKTPGMAQVISLCGIIGACLTVQKPLYPFVAHTDSFTLDGSLSVDDQERESTRSTLARLGSGFHQAWDSAAFTDMDELSMVIQHACDFTIIIESYVQGWSMPRTFTTIIDQRNFVQHSLMSLKSKEEIFEFGGMNSNSVYESCRLAAIVYSFLVIFPLPPITGPLEIITDRLTQELSATRFDDGALPTRRMHLWVLVMGAIAAIGLPERSWFLLEIQLLLVELKVGNWEGLKQILQGFLWHPSTNDPDGEDVWNEIQEIVVSEF